MGTEANGQLASQQHVIDGLLLRFASKELLFLDVAVEQRRFG